MHTCRSLHGRYPGTLQLMQYHLVALAEEAVCFRTEHPSLSVPTDRTEKGYHPDHLPVVTEVLHKAPPALCRPST